MRSPAFPRKVRPVPLTCLWSLLVLAAPPLLGQPDNDGFGHPFVLTGFSAAGESASFNATKEPGEPNHAGVVGGHSAWWKWTAPASGPVAVDFKGSTAISPVIAVYSGATLDTLVPVAAGSAAFSFMAQAGVTYGIAMDQQVLAEHLNGLYGLRLALPPTNDNFADAALIPGLDMVVTGTTFGATPEPGEPGAGPGNSIWWRWTADVSAPIFVARTGGIRSTQRVFTGAALATLEAVAMFDYISSGNEGFFFNAVFGTQYWIQVDNPSVQPGEVRVILASSPINDLFANAGALTGSVVEVSGDALGAGREPGEPAPHAYNPHSVWWKWTAPVSGQFVAGAAGKGVGVYTGSAVNALTALGAGPVSMNFTATAGVTYHIAVDNLVDEDGNYTLRLQPVPANDNFADATVITGSAPQQFTEDRLGATQEVGESTHGVASTRSLWWRWTAPASGPVLITTLGSDFRTGLDVYTGSALNALTAVGSSRDYSGTLLSVLNFTATAGQTYRIAVGGGNFNGTTQVLNFSADPVLPTVLVQPVDTAVMQGTSAQFSIGAYGNPAPTHQWQRLPLGASEWVNVAGLGFSGATSATLGLGSTTGSSGDQYRCMVTNSAGSVFSAPAVLTRLSAPVNNAFANATALPRTAQLSVNVTNVRADKQSGEPNHAGFPGGASVWWTWTAPGGGVVSLDTAGSDFNTLLAVYTGTGLTNLTASAGNNDRAEDLTSAVAFNVTAGTLYRIAVDGAQGATGNIVLSLSEVTTAANDMWADATPIPADGGTFTADNTPAGSEADEPDHLGQAATRSLWWRWTAPADGPVLVDTLGSEVSTRLGVYSGADITGLVPVVTAVTFSDAGASALNFDATAGVEYRIVVDGSPGNLSLTLHAPLLAPVLFRSPESTSVPIAGAASFQVTAYGNPAPSQYVWQRKLPGAADWTNVVNGSGHTGATTRELTLSGVQPEMDGTQYRILVTNAAGNTTSAPATLTVLTPSVPVITQHPASTLVLGLGRNATFSAVGFGSPVPSLQWQRQAAGSTAWEDVPGATGEELEVVISSSSQVGDRYRAVSTNSQGSAVSRPAVVLLPTAALAFQALETNTTATGWVTTVQNPSLPGAVVNPPESGIVAVAAGRTHILWLTAQGTVHGAGGTFGGSIPVPADVSTVVPDNPVVGLSTWYGTYATRLNGARDGWGNTHNLNGDYVNVNVTQNITLGITPDQSVAVAGAFESAASDTTPPPNLRGVVATAAGSNHALALIADGTVVQWGHSSVVAPPAGLRDVVAIAANDLWSVALKADGTVTQWGNFPVAVPTGLNNVVAIAGGYDHVLALKRDGTVVGWGSNAYGEISGPQGKTQVIALAAGVRSSAVLQKNTWDVPVIVAQPSSAILSGNQTSALLFVGAVGPGNLTYQWYKDTLDNPIPGATASSYATYDLSGPANFYVRVSNEFGSVTSVPATVVPLPRAAVPVISPAGGHFALGQQVTVTLASETPGASIRYTTDGSWPTANSTLYSGPFMVASYQTVRAQAYAPDMLASRDASAVFRYPAGVLVWGLTSARAVPPGLDRVVAVAGGASHALALESDGTVTAWGGSNQGQANVPAGLSNVTAIAAGGNHSLAVKSDGSVVAWGTGNGTAGTATGVPAGLGNVVAVAAGANHSVALRADGTLAAWGGNATVNTVPASAVPFVAIAAGSSHSLALRADGRVALWGTPPQSVAGDLTDIVAIGAQGGNSLALKRDGTLVRFGLTGNISIPAVASPLVQIAGGASMGVGLRPDGSPLAWQGGSPQPSTFSGVVGVGVGNSFGLAIVPITAPPAIVAAPASIAVAHGETTTLSVQTTGVGLTYNWYQGPAGDTSSLLVGATVGTPLAAQITSVVRGNFTTPALTESLPVWVRVSNPAGSVDSATASIFVATPGYASWAQGLGFASGTANFGPAVTPFADGLPNLLRYALNLGAAPASGQLPATTIEIVEGVPYLTLQFRRRKALPGVVLAPQFSSDLAVWQEIPPAQLTQLADDDADTERWQARLPLLPDGRLFLRLRATEN